MLTLSAVRLGAVVPARTLLTVPDMRISAGDRIVVRGHSGAGKSLLLGAIAGRLPAGIAMSGTRTTAPSPLRIGFVPQRGADALHPLISIGAQLRRVTGSDRDRVASVLAEVGLDDPNLARRRPAELSGGQAQRAAIALAVLAAPALVIADEPTSALDPLTRDEVLEALQRVLPASAALVLTTHDEDVARALPGRQLRVAHNEVHEVVDGERAA